jgi:hypothetical protein
MDKEIAAGTRLDLLPGTSSPRRAQIYLSHEPCPYQPRLALFPLALALSSGSFSVQKNEIMHLSALVHCSLVGVMTLAMSHSGSTNLDRRQSPETRYLQPSPLEPPPCGRLRIRRCTQRGLLEILQSKRNEDDDTGIFSDCGLKADPAARELLLTSNHRRRAPPQSTTIVCTGLARGNQNHVRLFPLHLAACCNPIAAAGELAWRSAILLH